jgi:hypothetical protein
MIGLVVHSLAGTSPLRPGRTLAPTRPGSLSRSGFRPFGVDRNICHFLWYGVVAGEGLRSVGAASPSKSVCSILPIARRWRAGEVFSGSTPARGSPLLSSAALGGPILQRGLCFAPSLRDSGLWVTMPGGGTRLGEEVRDGPHRDNRGGGNRGGVAHTAASLRPQARPGLSGSGLYVWRPRPRATYS